MSFMKICTALIALGFATSTYAESFDSAFKHPSIKYKQQQEQQLKQKKSKKNERATQVKHKNEQFKPKRWDKAHGFE